ncbi:MAG TPA: hypothetical protein VF321_00040 [Gaiellaceae bacterium]|jgi:hypothetical protein
MGLFRRRKEETLNERMLREAGLDGATEAPDPEAAAPEDPSPADPFAGTYPAQNVLGLWIRAMARPGEYDAVVSVHAPEIHGDTAEFATLPNGDMIVDTEQGDADLSPLADAVEKHVEPPYRVVARRGEADMWSVATRGIDVLELDFSGGDEIELASIDGHIDLKVDGEPWNGRIPELEHAGEAANGEDYVVQAERLDGDLWEVRASPL